MNCCCCNGKGSTNHTRGNCLQANVKVGVRKTDHGNRYTLGDNTKYKSPYYLKKGQYRFYDIPEGHPMAILNLGQTRKISYTGNAANRTSRMIKGSTANGQYDFYHGEIKVTVHDSFVPVSIHCANHGSMGGTYLLEYDRNCQVMVPNVNTLDSTRPNRTIPTNTTILGRNQRRGNTISGVDGRSQSSNYQPIPLPISNDLTPIQGSRNQLTPRTNQRSVEESPPQVNTLNTVPVVTYNYRGGRN
jgi:hypothetical protein